METPIQLSGSLVSHLDCESRGIQLGRDNTKLITSCTMHRKVTCVIP